MTRVLFLQPKPYFERLGVDFSRLEFEADFGIISLRQFQKNVSRYDAVVNCIDHSLFCRAICILAEKVGIPSILIMDGVFEWENSISNPYLKKIGVQLLSPVSYSNAMVVDKGLQNYLSKTGVNSSMYSSNESVVKPVSKGDMQASVLITTANNPYFNEAEKERLCDLLERVISELVSMGVSFKFRIYDDYLKSRFSIAGSENITGGAFEDIVTKFSCVISTPSTIVQTSMELGIPVAILDYRDSPVFLNSGWRIHGSIDLKSTLASILEPDEDRMRFQSNCISSRSANKVLGEMVDLRCVSIKVEDDNLLQSPFVFSLEYPIRKLILFVRRHFKKTFQGLLTGLKK